MRVKLLRDEDGATVRLVYPGTLAEYGDAFETLGALAGPAGDGGPDAGRDHAGGSYVVTTESQRSRWQLPDLWLSGRARVVVDESEAFDLLSDAVAAPPRPAAPGDAELEALDALTAPDPRLGQVLEALERIDLPGAVCETLRRELRRTLASRTVGKVVDRAQRVLRLPWRRRSPARFDACLWRWRARTAGAGGCSSAWSRCWGPARRARAC